VRERTKVITPEAAAQLVLDGDTVAVGGFVGIAVPEELLIALEEGFLATGGPRDLARRPRHVRRPAQTSPNAACCASATAASS
jgi:acyl CoA:acetate/3-ketoacid CoA transferase